MTHEEFRQARWEELMRQIISNFIHFKAQIKKVCAFFGILYQLEFQP